MEEIESDETNSSRESDNEVSETPYDPKDMVCRTGETTISGRRVSKKKSSDDFFTSQTPIHNKMFVENLHKNYITQRVRLYI